MDSTGAFSLQGLKLSVHRTAALRESKDDYLLGADSIFRFGLQSIGCYRHRLLPRAGDVAELLYRMMQMIDKRGVGSLVEHLLAGTM